MYNYKFENGHCIVEIEGYKWMIDSGAPSMSFNRNISSIEIDGRKFSLLFVTNYEAIVNQVVGIVVDGIIGCDILSKTSFSLDVKGNFCFGMDLVSTENHIGVKIGSIIPNVKNNVIIGKITIDCDDAEVLFDTGAHINYIKPELVDPSYIKGRNYDLEDFDLEGRKIMSISFVEICRIGDICYKVHCGIPEVNSYPIKVMNKTETAAIIGLYDFGFKGPIFHECFGIDYKNKKLFIR